IQQPLCNPPAVDTVKANRQELPAPLPQSTGNSCDFETRCAQKERARERLLPFCQTTKHPIRLTAKRDQSFHRTRA
ncbi:hypothetical protein GGI22_007963, partial [Coemansia erecta]